MLLGASSNAIDTSADLIGVLGSHASGTADDFGVAGGATLVAFAEAAHRGENVSEFRGELGEEAFVHAAATVAIFNGLVRTADATGIPLDAGTQALTVASRSELGLNKFRGFASSPAEASEGVQEKQPLDASQIGSVFR